MVKIVLIVWDTIEYHNTHPRHSAKAANRNNIPVCVELNLVENNLKLTQ